jgi:hypothetical protein
VALVLLDLLEGLEVLVLLQNLEALGFLEDLLLLKDRLRLVPLEVQLLLEVLSVVQGIDPLKDQLIVN